jgi:hypothetical protein
LNYIGYVAGAFLERGLIMAGKYEYFIEIDEDGEWTQLYETTENGAEARRWYEGEVKHSNKDSLKMRLTQRVTKILEAT